MTVSIVSRGSSWSRDRSRIVVAVRSSSSSYTAMLSILLANRIDDRCRNSHGCASRCGWGNRDRVGTRSTSTNGSSLGRRVGVWNRVRSGSATTDRRVLWRRVGVGDRIRTGSTASAERRSNDWRKVGVGNRVRTRSTTEEGSTLGRIDRDWEWAWSAAVTWRGRVRTERWTAWMRV
jgi:hypothetical protein